MKYDIQINGENHQIEIISKDNNEYKICIDDEIVIVDVVRVADMAYSIIYNGISYNIEVVNSNSRNTFIGSSLYNSFELKVIDAQTKYIESRKKTFQEDGINTITSPMPGKVVRIPIREGDDVESGQILVVITAMKMENEYKSSVNGKIKKIFVKEGENVESNQVLIVIENN
jgi:biotin carboxyl carrier protein